MQTPKKRTDYTLKPEDAVEQVIETRNSKNAKEGREKRGKNLLD